MTLSVSRIESKVRSHIYDIRGKLDRLAADPASANQARQVLHLAGDPALATARLEALNQYGNLT